MVYGRGLLLKLLGGRPSGGGVWPGGGGWAFGGRPSGGHHMALWNRQGIH